MVLVVSRDDELQEQLHPRVFTPHGPDSGATTRYCIGISGTTTRYFLSYQSKNTQVDVPDDKWNGTGKKFPHKVNVNGPSPV